MLLFLAWFAVLPVPGTTGDEEKKPKEPVLPSWNESELKELEKGNYVPGSSLMGRLARESLDSKKEDVIELTEAVRALPEEIEEEKGDPTKIPEEMLAAYFQQKPKGLLNDPQELLTTQEFGDQENPLAYHASEVGIGLFLYLLDREQKRPEGLDLAGLVSAQFDQTMPAAVVFYYLGAPERTEVAYTERGREAVSQEDRTDILALALEEAAEKSEPSSQLQAFTTEFSFGLGRLEERLREGGQGYLLDGLAIARENTRTGVASEAGWFSRMTGNPTIFWSVAGLGLAVLATLLGFLGRWIAGRNKSYIFPDAEGSTLFEAPHAAGVGGVLSFASSQTPPSRQESDVPDYLQRM